ncbi:HTH-type transcriptional repressor NicR [Posidoniimonas corsicana]|uniref:HTH-type transcriptional repressor NicR n=1 Tax=Posidoniimonas corsicana TaxID=1938618 RepID=A0A5C5USP8_9BACT|nr:MarR family transcriptional regulator [Posidoniimonas corsicana]TWT29404.1 HTH-type transcriptional repressor NicR [Posidoniimonas corsicana]
MTNYDFEDSIGFWLAVTHQAYTRRLESTLAPHGITYRQAQVLGYLALEGPLFQADLAAKMLIEPPSLVGVIDRMEAAELIERQPCPDDRRKKMIHPLPGSNQVWKKVTRCAKNLRTEASEGLSDREQATLKRLLKKVRDNVA